MGKILTGIAKTFAYLGSKDGTLRLRAFFSLAYLSIALAAFIYGGEGLFKYLSRNGGVFAIALVYGGTALGWGFILNWMTRRAEQLGL
ncbi:MAG: hypothetical protein AAF654_08820 [Myxococcota bacterium]